MKGVSFLSAVANSLLSRFGNNLSEIVIVFPGLRPQLFLNQCLYNQSKSPLLAPQYKTIESLFQELSPLKIGEEIQLILELYSVYIKIYNRLNSSTYKDTIDEFFFLGNTLLNDFNDIDKNIVDTSLLFKNLYDLDELDNKFSYLSDTQLQALFQYFKSTFHGNTILQTNFKNIWELLGDVYTAFREQLIKKNLAYSGMLMRHVIEEKEISFHCKHYAFVGFNALNKCEECLFKILKDKASFYWDYDYYYFHTEAGEFIEKNIRLFGSALNKEYFDNFLNINQKIEFIASPSQSGQSAVISKWINSVIVNDSSSSSSAIVLCDDTILPSIMHSIPFELMKSVNITMGFPICQTAIGSFMYLWIEMQIEGYCLAKRAFESTYVLALLRHCYGRFLFSTAVELEKEILQKNIFYLNNSDLHKSELFVFTPDVLTLIQVLIRLIREIGKFQKNNSLNIKLYDVGLEQESIFRACLMLNNLYSLFSVGYSSVGKPFFFNLFKKYLSKTVVPFKNTSLYGLQIMGVLETRTLDFKRILLLNVNEGIMPTTHTENTLIPGFLRKYFGMNTSESTDSIYAYHFYRLLSRVKEVTLVYTTYETPTGTPEMSRFLLQLLLDNRLQNRIKRFVLQSRDTIVDTPVVPVENKQSIIQKIKEKYDLNFNLNAKSLSVSSIICWINCNYRFYLEHIKELKEEKNFTFEINRNLFGLLFHRAAEILYRRIGIGNVIYAETLEKYVKSPKKLREIVFESFQKEIFNRSLVSKREYNGEYLIKAHILYKMLDRLLRFDQKQAPFTILGIELPISVIIDISKGKHLLKIDGIIDRLQKNEDKRHQVIDYKTSHEELLLRNVSDWFAIKNQSVFQTLLYSTLYAKKEKHASIIPSLFYIHQLDKADYDSLITYNWKPIKNFREYEKMFSNGFKKKIEELFDPTVPFSRTKNRQICHYCSFKEFCNR